MGVNFYFTMGDVPPKVRWNSFLGKDAINCSLARANGDRNSGSFKCSTFREDGSLKDAKTLKKTIAEESGKFWMNLALTELWSSTEMPEKVSSMREEKPETTADGFTRVRARK